MILPFDPAARGRTHPQILTPLRRAWVHDLDGVHHTYQGIPDIYAFYAQIKYQTLREDLPHLSREDIRRIGLESYATTGDGLIGFVATALESGLAPEKEDMFREGLFRLFHKEKFEWVSQHASGILEPCQRTIDLMDRICGQGVRMGLLTQGCFPNWAQPILEARGTLPFFDRHACLDFHSVGYETKKHSTRPLEAAMKFLRATPEEVVFIEDSIDNLITAKSLSPAILCTLISPVPLKPEYKPYVDLHMPDLVTFLEYAHTVYCPKPPRLENVPT